MDQNRILRVDIEHEPAVECWGIKRTINEQAHTCINQYRYSAIRGRRGVH